MMASQVKFPNTLKALSIAGPYAYWIATGEKQSEGRSWKTNFRGIVLLHVSTGKQFGEPQHKEFISSIIGAAELYDCTPNKEYEGYYDHWMRYPVLFKRLIRNVSGAHKYWKPRAPEHTKAFNLSWEQIQEQAPYLFKESALSEDSSRVLITPPPQAFAQ